MSQIFVPRGWKEKNGLPFFQGKTNFGAKYPTPTTWCSEPKKIAKKNDILISVRAPVGPTNWAKEKCCIGRGLSAIRTKINPEFVYYYLKFLEPNLSKSGTGSTFKAIGRDYLENLPVPVPQPEIQKKIVQKLDYILGQLEEKKKEILELQKIKSQQSKLLSDNFMSFLIADLIPTENYPSTWEQKTLDETFEEVKDKWVPNSKSENLNYIGLENIESNTGKLVEFSPTDSLEIKSTKTYFTKNDVLYGKLRPYLNKVLLPTFDGVCSTDIIVLKPKSNISKEFLAFFLRSSHVLLKMTKLMYGTKMPRAKIQDLQDIKIGLPPKKEQQQIVKKLQDSEKIIDTVKQSVNKITKQQEELTKYLQHLQSSILEQAFSGKLVN